jgi:hypothetical protein
MSPDFMERKHAKQYLHLAVGRHSKATRVKIEARLDWEIRSFPKEVAESDLGRIYSN